MLYKLPVSRFAIGIWKEAMIPAVGEFHSLHRRLGCDEDKDRFEKKLGPIAKAKPEDKGESRL
jgi:hypothetical protein